MGPGSRVDHHMRGNTKSSALHLICRHPITLTRARPQSSTRGTLPTPLPLVTSPKSPFLLLWVASSAASVSECVRLTFPLPAHGLPIKPTLPITAFPGPSCFQPRTVGLGASPAVTLGRTALFQRIGKRKAVRKSSRRAQLLRYCPTLQSLSSCHRFSNPPVDERSLSSQNNMRPSQCCCRYRSLWPLFGTHDKEIKMC